MAEYDDYLKAHREGVAAAAKKAAPKAPPKNPDDVPPRNLQDALDEVTRRKIEKAPTTKTEMGKIFKKGGKVGSASKRADGCAQRGKTRGKFV